MSDEKQEVPELEQETVPQDVEEFIAGLNTEEESEEPEQSEQQDQEDDQVDPSIEAEARKYGWRPKDEWRGDKSGWVDPKRFLELPSTHVKQLRAEKEAEAEEFQRRLERLERGNRAALDAQKRQHEAELARLKQERRRAAEDGDMDMFDRLDKEVADAEGVQFDEPEPEQPKGPHPDVKAYMDTDEGAWIKNPVLVAEGSELINGSKIALSMSPIDQVKWAEQQLRARYPQMFPQPEPEKPERKPRVDGGGLASGKQQGLFNKLPPEAKRAAKEFKEAGYISSLEEYAKTYFEGESA